VRLRTLSRVLIGTVILVFVGLAAFAATTPRGDAPGWEDAGATFSGKPAPNFSLHDQNGHLISLTGQRGRAVVLTFFYTHCADTCPLTAQKLRAVLRRFGAESARISVLIVTTDPLRDNEADARIFLRKNGLPGWHFLLGKYRTLARIWRRYGIYVPSPAQRQSSGPAHSAVTYLIDSKGRQHILLDDAAPAPVFAQDLHILLRDHQWLQNLPKAPIFGDRAPDLNLPSLTSGERVRLTQFRGKPVMINFWATTCLPCLSEMPLLERTYRRYHGKLQILGVDDQEPANEVGAFVRQDHITYPIALDSQGNTVYSYQLAGTPTTFFLDARGVIQDVHAGPLTGYQVTREVDSLLSGS
jgi:cytochrome c biogenesis protein CcmG, thiol:disulfide interchange protein DsbE